MASVTLEGVSKVFPGPVRAVDQLQLALNDGQLVVLAGPSGCGKTTTLRLIAGLEQATEGVIRVGGRVVNRLAPRHRDVAMVFQQPVLFPHLTVADNLAFGLRMRWGPWGLGRRWARRSDRKVRQAARMLGIDQLLDRMPDQLSGGQQQRVALGRAIVRRPAAFLLDEPLAGQDPERRAELRHQLRLLGRRMQATILYVTHDRTDAMCLADRIVVMDDGRVQQTGTPEVVYADPNNLMVAKFFSQPQLNCVRGRWEWRDDRLRFVAAGVSLALDQSEARAWGFAPGQEVVLGVRPEDARFAGCGQVADVAGCLVARQRWGSETWYEVALPPSTGVSGTSGEGDARWLLRRASGPAGPAELGATGEVQLSLPRARLLWFDVETGARRRAVAAFNPASE